MTSRKIVLKVVCAWCGTDMGEKDGEGQTGISHGICEECFHTLRVTGRKEAMPYKKRLQEKITLKKGGLER